jgi:hypothetical protein
VLFEKRTCLIVPEQTILFAIHLLHFAVGIRAPLRFLRVRPFRRLLKVNIISPIRIGLALNSFLKVLTTWN